MLGLSKPSKYWLVKQLPNWTLSTKWYLSSWYEVVVKSAKLTPRQSGKTLNNRNLPIKMHATLSKKPSAKSTQKKKTE